jgi:hypothetical protein
MEMSAGQEHLKIYPQIDADFHQLEEQNVRKLRE